jgi:uncharacterized membrane protein YfcA
MPEQAGNYILLCLAAIAAGVMNSIAGGGTLLTFPALLNVIPPVEANATSTVALVPGSLSAAWGYRREMQATRRWLLLLAVPSVLGGWLGARLLTSLDPSYFKMLIPWLILLATILFLFQPMLGRWIGIGEEHAPASGFTVIGVVFFQFLVSVYGGYFGAGIGILMLSALALIGIADIHHMNALKTLLAVFINGVSVFEFVRKDKVVWGYALIMAAAAIVGGYLGARVARRLNRTFVRWVVIAIGFGLAGYFFWKQLTMSPGGN